MHSVVAYEWIAIQIIFIAVCCKNQCETFIWCWLVACTFLNCLHAGHTHSLCVYAVYHLFFLCWCLKVNMNFLFFFHHPIGSNLLQERKKNVVSFFNLVWSVIFFFLVLVYTVRFLTAPEWLNNCISAIKVLTNHTLYLFFHIQEFYMNTP